MPVLSSDDESDRDNSQTGDDDRKVHRRASPPRLFEGGAGKAPHTGRNVPAEDAGTSSAEGGTGSRVTPVPLPQGQQVFFTTTDFYLVLRMHHLLAERLAEAKRLCRDAGLSRQTVVASPQEVRAIPKTFRLIFDITHGCFPA